MSWDPHLIPRANSVNPIWPKLYRCREASRNMSPWQLRMANPPRAERGRFSQGQGTSKHIYFFASRVALYSHATSTREAINLPTFTIPWYRSGATFRSAPQWSEKKTQHTIGRSLSHHNLPVTLFPRIVWKVCSSICIGYYDPEHSIGGWRVKMKRRGYQPHKTIQAVRPSHIRAPDFSKC